MKTSVKLKLRASQRMPRHGILIMQITRSRVTRTMTTSYVLSFDEWDDNGQKIVFSENASSKRKKELAVIERKLKKDLKELYETIDVLEAHGDYSSQELIYRFRERQQGQMFCSYAWGKVEILQSDGRFGTARAYFFAIKSFLRFLVGRDIRINKINAALMEDYERYLLSRNNSPNTVSCYMRSLRAVYNLAIREKLLVVEKAKDKPFSSVFTGNAKTRKKAINGKSISKLMSLDKLIGGYKVLNKVEKTNGVTSYSLAFSRDLFLFSFYTQGMSFIDIANLKKENIKNDVIKYKRKKTGQLITIEMEDCIREIIEQYMDSDSDFVFPILRESKDAKDYEKWKETAKALIAYNKNLKKLASLACISEHLTSYVARHSWATIASQEGIPMATISRGMGHESEKTTRIYISQIDYSDVGRANRQILSRIFAHIPLSKSPYS